LDGCLYCGDARAFFGVGIAVERWLDNTVSGRWRAQILTRANTLFGHGKSQCTQIDRRSISIKLHSAAIVSLSPPSPAQPPLGGGILLVGTLCTGEIG
jgi:hypothetical protein